MPRAATGRSPERTTYKITADGRRELQAWVRAGLAEPDNPEAFQVAISFMYALPQAEATELLEQRAATLDALIQQADAALSDAARTVPPIFLSEEHYAQHMRTAERDWIAHFTKQLRSDQLDWPQPGRT